MSNSHINNKRIAKNTALLYVRTLFVMLVSLYTSRVILETLGVQDYGVYQVIGGMVTLFSVISNALSSAISRFITFEIGRGDVEKLKLIFSSSKIIQFVISVIVFVIAEIIGIWFMHSKMQIPDGRMYAAIWVLQCTLMTFCINLISVPYNACIIAHEHMKAFAYISILDVLAKLGVCYLIVISPFDRLITYAVLLTLIALGIRIIYAQYCLRHFEESRCGLRFEKGIFKEIASFAGWNFFTNTSSIFNNQGVTMLVNVFFGVTANAARGLASQVENAVLHFVNSFTTAINPQITKSYANKDKDGMYLLVCRGAKYSYLAMLFFSIPLIMETESVLNIWLTTVPENTITFVRLSLILGMLDCLGRSSFTACLATGKMKRYALILTPVACLEFPLAWLFFFFGAPVVSCYYVFIVVKTLVLAVRLYLLKDMLGFNPKVFVNNVYLRIFPSTIFALLLPILIVYLIPPSLFRVIISVVIGVLSVSISSLYIAMSSHERNLIVQKVNNFKKRVL